MRGNPFQEKELLGPILGFRGSPWHGLASIVEGWEPIKGGVGTLSVPRMTVYFKGLGKDIPVNKERYFAVSTVA